MNDTNSHPEWGDQHLDRLVDGELSGEEYRRLLRSLDQHPDGWRRCALAFLEAQAWQRDLSAVRRQAIARDDAPPSPPARTPRRSRGWGEILAVAASFFVAFALGVAYQARRPEPPAAPQSAPLAQQDQASPSAPGLSDQEQEFALAPAESDAAPPAQASPGIEPRGYVTLATDRADGSGSGQLQIPLYEWSPEHTWWLERDPVLIPPDIERALKRMGRQIRWERRLVPVETEDGYRALVPIRRLEITPAGGPRYQ